MTPRQFDKARSRYDPDDHQATEIEAATPGVFLGRRTSRTTNGALMESVFYDGPMPVAPRPEWASIDEDWGSVPAETPAEAYDRRNGFGRRWGNPEPSELPRLEEVARMRDMFEEAGIDPDVAAVMAPVALIFIAAVERRPG